MGRRTLALASALALCCTTAALAVNATDWSGSTAKGGAVNFQIRDGRVTGFSFAVKMGCTDPNGNHLSLPSNLTFSKPFHAGSHVKVSQTLPHSNVTNGTIHLTGAFGSEHAKGTASWALTMAQPLKCGDLSGKTTWTAKRKHGPDAGGG